MLRFILKLILGSLCMIIVSGVLNSIGYSADTWQWWVIIILMPIYSLTLDIDE